MRYVLSRVGFALVTVFIAITLNFFLFRVMPGTAVTGLRCQNCSAQFKAAIVREYGLDKPKVVQYGIYLDDLARGDLGTSVYNNQAVWDDISGPLLNTLPMIIAGTVIAIVLGVASGVISAWRRGTAADAGSLWTSLACYAMPTQWIGLLVVFYVATAVGLPRAGISTATLGILGPPSTWAVLADRSRHLILPALTLGIGMYGQYALVVRSTMLETLGEDYILTARAKGLPVRRIVWRHAVRNALLPMVTLIALDFGYIVGGALLIEVIFSWPGIGESMYTAITQRDYPMLQGGFLILTVSVIVLNFLSDLVYFRLDPRISQ